jgi:hypothetical protein
LVNLRLCAKGENNGLLVTGETPIGITQLNSVFLYRQAGEFVSRVGIYSPLPDAEKLQFIAMNERDEKGYADKKSEYRKLYLQ